MTENLERLVEEARERPITGPELEAQAISFAYGNANFENPRVTREIVEEAARRLGPICNYADRCEHESGGRCRHAGYCVYQGPERRAPIGAKERK